jgi:hypothetical protein
MGLPEEYFMNCHCRANPEPERGLHSPGRLPDKVGGLTFLKFGD